MNTKDQYVAGNAIVEKDQSPFDALFDECECLLEVEKRLEALADRLCGPPPQGDVRLGTGVAAHDGLIDGLVRNVRGLRTTAEACMESLNRIERRL